ncbi:hypothetical protein, partial [Devosia limi]
RKRAPIDCLFAQPPVAQEPNRKNTRRPRFSFFHLHNVKDLTSLPKGLGRHRRHQGLQIP